MGDIKYSYLLQQLLDETKRMGKATGVISAENLIITVIDKLQSRSADDDAELLKLGQVLNTTFGNLQRVEDALRAYTSSDVMLDNLYLEQKLLDATELAEQVDSDTVDSVMVLSCILSNPSEVLRDLIEGKTEKPKPKTESLADQIRRILNKQEDEPEETPVSAKKPSVDDDDGDFFRSVPKAKQQPEPETAPEVEATPAENKEDMLKLVADVKRIRTLLKSAVYGQDKAIDVFMSGYFQASMRSILDKSRKRPRATFLFAGPPGVGKTFLAEQSAKALGLPFQRFDMSEYNDDESAVEFCGSDGVYKNSKRGNFTAYVDENPTSVILLDEIEKAHISIIHLFLQILDAGRIRDNQTDKEISLKDTILIFTTNAGRKLYEGSESGDLSGISRKVILNALANDTDPHTGVAYFPGAICSRFASGNVVMFNHIGAHNLRAIAKKEILRHCENMKQQTGIWMQLDELVYTALLLSEGANADARTMTSRAEAFFNDELYELFRMVSSDKVSTGVEDIERILFKVDLSGCDADTAKLFTAEENPRFLLLASQEVQDLCKKELPDFDIFGAQTAEEAVTLIKERELDFVLVDLCHGVNVEMDESINIADVDSPGRDLLMFLQQQRSELPIYLLESGAFSLSEEERVSYLSKGVRDIIKLSQDKNALEEKMAEIAAILYQQSSMMKLAKANKLLSFETAQSVSSNGRTAVVRLFDFKQIVAVDSEDSKSILSAVSKPNVHFDEILGANDAKTELKYFVEYLKNPKKYMGTGVKAPKGVLLYGPPGTGKTMLAKAMACESGVTFIAAEGNQFLKRYIGEGPEEVHRLFKTARKYAPSILFVDEIDTIAKERRSGDHAASNGEDVLNAFLAEMDGFSSDPTRPVFVLAATNFDVEPGSDRSLDPALMRRFDRRVYIDLPTKEDRIKFLRMKMAKNGALDLSDELIDNIAMRSTGMSLAQLDSVTELALRSAIRSGSTKVTDAVYMEAFETFNSGEVKKWDMSELERVARHEAGHALVCSLAGEKPSYLTIVARSNHGGYMQHENKEDKHISTKAELLARIRTALGGRAAEIVCYGEKDGLSTGASGDLVSATAVARHIIASYGMDEDFGLAVIRNAADNSAVSVELRSSINRILTEQMAEAVRIIAENRDKLDALVNALMMKNQLNGDEIAQIVHGTNP